MTATSADAVIIGAGVIGSSIALELAGTGRYIRTGVNEDSSFFVLG